MQRFITAKYYVYCKQTDYDQIQKVDFDSIYRFEVEDGYYEGLPNCNGDYCPINKH